MSSSSPIESPAVTYGIGRPVVADAQVYQNPTAVSENGADDFVEVVSPNATTPDATATEATIVETAAVETVVVAESPRLAIAVETVESVEAAQSSPTADEIPVNLGNSTPILTEAVPVVTPTAVVEASGPIDSAAVTCPAPVAVVGPGEIAPIANSVDGRFNACPSSPSVGGKVNVRPSSPSVDGNINVRHSNGNINVRHSNGNANVRPCPPNEDGRINIDFESNNQADLEPAHIIIPTFYRSEQHGSYSACYCAPCIQARTNAFEQGYGQGQGQESPVKVEIIYVNEDASSVADSDEICDAVPAPAAAARASTYTAEELARLTEVMRRESIIEKREYDLKSEKISFNNTRADLDDQRKDFMRTTEGAMYRNTRNTSTIMRNVEDFTRVQTDAMRSQANVTADMAHQLTETNKALLKLLSQKAEEDHQFRMQQQEAMAAATPAPATTIYNVQSMSQYNAGSTAAPNTIPMKTFSPYTRPAPIPRAPRVDIPYRSSNDYSRSRYRSAPNGNYRDDYYQRSSYYQNDSDRYDTRYTR